MITKEEFARTIPEELNEKIAVTAAKYGQHIENIHAAMHHLYTITLEAMPDGAEKYNEALSIFAAKLSEKFDTRDNKGAIVETATPKTEQEAPEVTEKVEQETTEELAAKNAKINEKKAEREAKEKQEREAAKAAKAAKEQEEKTKIIAHIKALEAPESSGTNYDVAVQFINDYLTEYDLPDDVLLPIIENNLKDHLKLKTNDVKNLRASYKRIKAERCEAIAQAKEQAKAEEVENKQKTSKAKAKGAASNNTKKDKRQKFEVPYDIVADHIMRDHRIITFDDTRELYVYENGVYRIEGAETKIDLAIREEFSEVFASKWEEIYGTEPPKHLPKAGGAYVAETMNYIRRKTAVFRSDIDEMYTHLINLKNGMFDTQEWKLIPHSPAYKSIKQIPVTYDPQAECPQINKFLTDIVSPEDAQVLIEFSGYSLIPDTKIQKAVMLYGEGSNGKSIFLRLLIAFVGGTNVSGVSLQKLEVDKFAAANLYGKLLNVYPDLKDQTVYYSDMFKTLVGGDRIDGEKKFKDVFSFYNKARLIFSANKIPAVKNNEFAYFRRWILINFPNLFEEGKNDDKDLFEKLTTQEELSGYLNLALEGLKKLMENKKYSYTKSIEDVTRLYRENSSSVSVFAESCLMMSTEVTEKSEMYEHYTQWAEVKNIKALAPNEFGKHMKKMGYEDDRPYDVLTRKKSSVWENVIIDQAKFCDEVTGRSLLEVWLNTPTINTPTIIPRPEPKKSFADIHPAQAHCAPPEKW